MTLPMESDLHIASLQLLDQSTLQATSPSYLTIQEKLAPLIPNRRPYPHLSLNPLSGNSMY